MRMLKTFAIVAVGLAFAAAPALATCVGNPALFTTQPTLEISSEVWTDGWDVTYGAGYRPWSSTMMPPYSAEIFGVYWSLGLGVPTLGTGVDSGTYVLPTAPWIYYQPFPDYGITYPGKIFGGWAQPGVDGCVEPLACECLLLTDEKNGVGYFAMLSARTDAVKSLDLSQPGTDAAGNPGAPIILREMPAPDVLRVDVDAGTNIATFNVTVPVPTAGVYMKDACNCGPTGYRIYEKSVPHGTAAPGDRDATGWTAVSPVTAMGVATSYQSTACTATDVDVYLAAGLVFNSNMLAAPYKVTLSKNNSEHLHCGTNMAEPEPLQPKIRRQRPELPRAERTR